jgi:hypothetical protein
VGLPLNDIEWDFYVPAGYRYFDFAGTMTYADTPATPALAFNADRYLAWNKERREATLQKARTVLDVGEELIKAGQQKRAKKALQAAFNYSQGQADLNEDARVQLRNLMKQQVKMGLVNRRDNVRFKHNIIDEQQLGQMEGFQDGDFTQEYVKSVSGRLSEKDNDALDVVADKIIDQQAAAAGVVAAIRVTMPEHGRLLKFRRDLQIDPAGELSVKFRSRSGRVTALLSALWPAVLLFLVLWAVSAAALRPRAEPAG